MRRSCSRNLSPSLSLWLRHELQTCHGELYLVHPHLDKFAEVSGAPLIFRYVLAHGFVSLTQDLIGEPALKEVGLSYHFVNEVFFVQYIKLLYKLVVEPPFPQKAHKLLCYDEQQEYDGDKCPKLAAYPVSRQKQQHKSE